MRLKRTILSIAYLAPPAGLLVYAVAGGAIQGWIEGFGFAIRLVVASAGSVALGIGLAGKVPYLADVDGARFYARLFPLYVVLFLALCFFFGLELQFPDEHRSGRYTY